MLKQRVGDVVSREVVGVDPRALLSEALEIMRDKRISCVPVLDQGKAVGIVTERGLLRHMVGNGGGLGDKPVDQVMSAPVATVHGNAFAYEALHTLVGKSIRHLVVVDDDGLAVGILTLSNLVHSIGSDLFIEFQPVDDLMSKLVHSLERDLPLSEILPLMAEKSISCMIYSQAARPQGMITERDVVRLALKNRDGADLGRIKMTSVMSSPVITVPLGVPVHHVPSLMREKGVRRVVVVDHDGRMAGLVTQSNIIRSLESNYIRILKEIIEEKDVHIRATSMRLDKLSLYLDTILNNSIDMAIVATDDQYHVVFYNDCTESVLGYRSGETLGRKVQDIHLLEEGVQAERFEAVMEKVRADGSHTFCFPRQVDGEERWFQARVSSILHEEGGVEGYVFMVHDITERRRAEENIRFMAYHDILTGLPNRVSFNERLRLELAHAERNKTRLAVLVLDLDRFKEVNDTMGHYGGDLLLEAVAGRLSQALRKSDTVARVGGDEFMMVLPAMSDNENVLAAVAKMAQSMEEPLEIKGKEWNITLSMGVSFYPEHGSKPDKLVELADQAMYRAKQEGHSMGGSNLCIWAEADPQCRRFGGD